MTGVAAALGGTYHGFGHVLAAGTRSGLWRLTFVTIAAANFFMLLGAAEAALSRHLHRAVLVLLLVRFALSAVLLSRGEDFGPVIVDLSVTLAGLLAFGVHQWVRGLRAAGRWIVAGTVVSIAGALVQALRLAPHPHFNHNDLFHVLQMASLGLLARGALVSD